MDLARHRSGFKRIVEQRAVDRGHPVVIVAEGDERRRCPAGHAQFVAERRNEPLGWCWNETFKYRDEFRNSLARWLSERLGE